MRCTSIRLGTHLLACCWIACSYYNLNFFGVGTDKHNQSRANVATVDFRQYFCIFYNVWIESLTRGRRFPQAENLDYLMPAKLWKKNAVYSQLSRMEMALNWECCNFSPAWSLQFTFHTPNRFSGYWILNENREEKNLCTAHQFYFLCIECKMHFQCVYESFNHIHICNWINIKLQLMAHVYGASRNGESEVNER